MQHFYATQRREIRQMHGGLSSLCHICSGQGLPPLKLSWSAQLSAKIWDMEGVWAVPEGQSCKAVFSHRMQLVPELLGGCGTPKRLWSQVSVYTGSCSLSSSSDFRKTCSIFEIKTILLHLPKMDQWPPGYWGQDRLHLFVLFLFCCFFWCLKDAFNLWPQFWFQLQHWTVKYFHWVYWRKSRFSCQ